MKHEHDEAFMMGQVASLIAVVSALVHALPVATRKRLVKQITPQFEALIAAMRSSGETALQTERKGAEWVRDLFLSQIAKADKTSKPRKSPSVASKEYDIQL